MPARAACGNERLLQRKNHQVTLTVRQGSTHCSICSRFRQWGTIREQSVGMDPLTIGVHVRNSTATHSQMRSKHFSGESVLFTGVDCCRGKGDQG